VAQAVPQGQSHEGGHALLAARALHAALANAELHPTAQAENRHFCMLSALCAHTKVPYKT
jgi:hypothetical protein